MGDLYPRPLGGEQAIRAMASPLASVYATTGLGSRNETDVGRSVGSASSHHSKDCLNYG